jgi:GntR family transcriptional regulator
MLREEGLLEAGRGKATTVAGTAQRGAVVERVKDLIAFGAREGYARDELVALIASLP